MTKSELSERIAIRFPQLQASDSYFAVKLILDAMAHTLGKGDRIEIRGFGSFDLNYRPPRMGRNPRTGEIVPVPGKYAPHFKVGKGLKTSIDGAPADGLAPAQPGRISAGLLSGERRS